MGEAGAGWTATHTHRPDRPHGAGPRERPAHAGNVSELQKTEVKLPSPSLDPKDGRRVYQNLPGGMPTPTPTFHPWMETPPFSRVVPAPSHLPSEPRSAGQARRGRAGGLRGGGECRWCSLAGSKGHSGRIRACPLSYGPFWNRARAEVSAAQGNTITQLCSPPPHRKPRTQAVSEGGQTSGPTRMPKFIGTALQNGKLSSLGTWRV